jgi:peptidyl-prolyl cis-trans isomerase B (cyclophilin B)
MKKFFTLTAAVLALIILFTGCKKRPQSAIINYDYSQMRLVQLEELYEGQPIAVITTSVGVIKVALYPEQAPATVANFIDRINEGFYNDSLILHVREGTAFYAGLNSEGYPKTSSDEGESLIIPNEYSVNMWPFKGALCAFGTQHGFSDSRFFMVNEEVLTESQFAQLRQIKLADGTQMLPDELLEAFSKVGCAVSLSGFFTIFGQTTEGLDVIEKITSAQTDPHSRPTEDIRIVTVELTYN